MIVWGERIGAAAAERAAAGSPSASAWPVATAPGCSRSRPAPTAAGCARPACCRTPDPATQAARRAPGRGATGDRPGRRRRRAHRALPVPDRPGPRPARSRAVGARAAQRGAGRRPRLGADRGAARARDRHLPGRVLRREGGHGRAPRRPPPAAADRDRPPGEVAPGWSVIAELARRCGLDLGVRAQRRCVRAAGRGGPVLRGPDARGDRRPRRPLARARRRRAAITLEPRRSRSASRRRHPCARPPPANGALRLGTYRPIWAAPEVEISPALQYTIAAPAGRALARGRRAARHRTTATR